jgi:signal transduction histidine kinase
MRNGLQGIHGGVDALTRAARAGKATSVPLEQLTQFVQQAITNHERGLERVLNSVAPEDAPASEVVVKDVIFELVKFLTNDAARNGARMKLNVDEQLKVLVLAAKLRLILLGLLVDAIDSLPSGGEIAISAQAVAGDVQIEISDSRAQRQANSFVTMAVDQLVPQLAARIDRKQSPDGRYQVQLTLRATGA